MNSFYSTTKALYHPDRLAALKRGEQPVPVHVEVILSDLCNQDCFFCLTDSARIFCADGIRSIKDVREGMLVLTKPYPNVSFRRVTKVFRRQVSGDMLRVLRFHLDDGEEKTLTITEDHPLKSAEGIWIPAVELTRGTRVSAISNRGVNDYDQVWATVTSNQAGRATASPYVYNLAVEGDEVYYANDILVHNCAYRLNGYSSNQLFQLESGTSRKARNPNRQIAYDKAIEIIDDCADMGVKAVQFTGGGSPTIHPQFAAIVLYAQMRGLETALVTNGSMLLNSEIREAVRGMTWVRVSIDAATPELYCRTRGVGRSMWDRVAQGVQVLVSEIKGSPYPLTIGTGFVATPDSWHELYDAVALYKSWGVHNVSLGLMFNPDGSKPYEPFRDEMEELARRATADFDEGNGGFRVINRVSEKLHELDTGNPTFRFCSYQHFTTYIGGDLNVYRCCVYAYNERGLVGSLKDQRFRELWDSQIKKDDFAKFNAHQCERCQFTEIIEKINAHLIGTDAPAHVNFV